MKFNLRSYMRSKLDLHPDTAFGQYQKHWETIQNNVHKIESRSLEPSESDEFPLRTEPKQLDLLNRLGVRQKSA